MGRRPYLLLLCSKQLHRGINLKNDPTRSKSQPPPADTALLGLGSAPILEGTVPLVAPPCQ